MNVQFTFPYLNMRVVRSGQQFTFQEKTKEGKWVQAAKVQRWGLAESLLLNYYRVSLREVHEAKVTMQRRLEERYEVERARRERHEAEYAAARAAR